MENYWKWGFHVAKMLGKFACDLIQLWRACLQIVNILKQAALVPRMAMLIKLAGCRVVEYMRVIGHFSNVAVD